MNPTRPLPTPALAATDWWSVATVTIGITVFAVAQGLTYPLISLLLAERGASDAMVGLNAAAFMLGLATSVLVVPALTRHLRAGQAIVAGLIGAAVILVGFAVTDALATWFVLRFALGFCVNAIYVFGEAWLNAATADSVRGRVSGLYGAGMTTGFAIGPLAIPVMGTDDGLAFAACAVLVSLTAFGLALMSRRASVEPDKFALIDLPHFARAAPLLLFLVLAFGFVDGTVLALAPLHLTAGGASVSAAAIFVAVTHMGMIVAQPFLGPFARPDGSLARGGRLPCGDGRRLWPPDRRARHRHARLATGGPRRGGLLRHLHQRARHPGARAWRCDARRRRIGLFAGLRGGRHDRPCRDRPACRRCAGRNLRTRRSAGIRRRAASHTAEVSAFRKARSTTGMILNPQTFWKAEFRQLRVTEGVRK